MPVSVEPDSAESSASRDIVPIDLYLIENKNGGYNMEKVNHVPMQHTFLNIRQLTVSGFLAAITIFLGLTGYGFIPLLFMDATILHIPTIIGSIAAGPRVGALVGFMFGLFSFIQTLRAPSLLLQFAVQYNIAYDAIVCIVPRILIGIIAYEIYSHLRTKMAIRVAVAAVLTTILHTILFLGTLFILVGAPYAAMKGISVAAVGNIFIGITLANGIPEAIVSGIIVTPIIMALHRSGWHVK